MSVVHYHAQQVGDVKMFYRAAGPVDAPVLLLLHGFPSASHMFRDLIPELADRYRVIAPDLPGFGQTKAPARGAEAYRQDLPEAEVHLLDTGHFALETHSRQIADHIRDFLTRKLAN
jgi:pimeloyl-ACP methyl ester carboxylesterase